MTPVQISNGFAATEQLELATRQPGYQMAYFHDAPLAVGMATEVGSYLITGNTRPARAAVLLKDLVHVAETMYVSDTTVIDCQAGAMREGEVREALRVADANSSVARKLIIVNNLDCLIGRGTAEPTRLQQFAIDTLLKWTSGNEALPGYSGHAPDTGKRNICATSGASEQAMHPLRAMLIGSFAGKHSLVGTIHLLSSVSEAQEVSASQAVAA